MQRQASLLLYTDSEDESLCSNDDANDSISNNYLFHHSHDDAVDAKTLEAVLTRIWGNVLENDTCEPDHEEETHHRPAIVNPQKIMFCFSNDDDDESIVCNGIEKEHEYIPCETKEEGQKSNDWQERHGVRFGAVEVQEYALTLGDPHEVKAFPLSLDWDHTSIRAFAVDDYEAEKEHHKQQQQKQQQNQFQRLTPLKRLTEKERCSLLMSVLGLESARDLYGMERQRVELRETEEQLLRQQRLERLERLERKNKKKAQASFYQCANTSWWAMVVSGLRGGDDQAKMRKKF